MHPIPRTPIAISLARLAAPGPSAGTAPPPLDSVATMRLASLQAAPDSVGTRIYHGEVFAQTPGDPQALFHYERRVVTSADGLTAPHITYDTREGLLIVQAAAVSPAYTLQRLDIANRQTGNSGSAIVSADGHYVDYTLRQGDAVQTDCEAISDPLVSGPSLHGFVLRHWDLQASGASVPVRMVVLDALRSSGFDIRQTGYADNGQTTFSITPSSWLVRLAIAPLRVTFDNTTRQVLSYEGRVPPRLEADGKLRTLDARVLCRDHAPRYR
jgi:hypothetical protein